MPRIIAGAAKKIKLAAPAGNKTRPTGDRVKEALFSILTTRIPASGFLDLYAGTGQIGLEAASRGSDNVVLIENDRGCITIIKENITRTGLETSVELLPGDVRKILKTLQRSDRQFEIIYLDPPYKAAVAEFCALAGILEILLADNGVVVLEHGKDDNTPANVTNLQLSRRCQYGSAMLSFYHHRGGKAVN